MDVTSAAPPATRSLHPYPPVIRIVLIAVVPVVAPSGCRKGLPLRRRCSRRQSCSYRRSNHGGTSGSQQISPSLFVLLPLVSLLLLLLLRLCRCLRAEALQGELVDRQGLLA